jgi:tetratricopeptide (TPR) repeat protein
MNNPKPMSKQRVRFEEVTPANTVVAFFEAQLKSLVASLQLPIFDGYDDLDEMQFTFLTLPSGHTVTIQEYGHSPQAGVNLFVDRSIPNISSVIFEACQRLEIPRSKVIWFHPDFQEVIDQLYAEHGGIEKKQNSLPVEELQQSRQYEPIDCFNHALQIYTRQEFPEYWAMLQHNLGLAYFDRSQVDLEKNMLKECQEDLKQAVKCFNSSLEIYTQDNFPEKWEINHQDLKRTQQLIESLRSEIKPARTKYFELLHNSISEHLQEVVWDFAGASIYILGVYFIEYYLKAGFAKEGLPDLILLTLEFTLLIKLFTRVVDNLFIVLRKAMDVFNKENEIFAASNNLSRSIWLKVKFTNELTDLSGKFIVGALTICTLYFLWLPQRYTLFL